MQPLLSSFLRVFLHFLDGDTGRVQAAHLEMLSAQYCNHTFLSDFCFKGSVLLEDQPHRHSRDGFSNSVISKLTITEFLVYAKL